MTAPEPGGRPDLRLVPAAAAAWAVTAAGITWPPWGAPTAAAVATAATALVGWLGSGRPDPRTAAAVLGAAVTAVAALGAGLAVAVGLRTAALADHPLAARYGLDAAVTVTPTETPRPAGGGRVVFRADLRALDGGPATGRVVVFASGARFGGLAAGRPAAFTARVGRPTRRDLTVAVLTARGEPELGRAGPLSRAAAAVRTRFAAAAALVLPADQAAVLPGLVLGDTSAVSAVVTEEFRIAGLTHLTAVSGANVTIVCGTVLLSAALLGPRLAVALAGLTLVAFVIVVQPSASVLRAAVMAAVTLLALVTGRRRRALPALCAAVVVLVVAAPELAVDVGFALSVAATAALIVLAPRWSQRLVAAGWPKPAADAVAVATAAQLVTAPLIAGISGRFSVVAVAANLAVAAVIPPITVLGTAAAALAAVWPDAAMLLIRFTGPAVWWLLQVAHRAAALPGAALPTPSGAGGVALVAAATLAVVAGWRVRWVRAGTGLAVAAAVAWAVAGSLVGAA